MRFLVDEDLPRSAGSLLREHGHHTTDIRDVGLRGATDADIAAYAQKHRLCLLSCDFDFADIRNYPPKNHHGVVVLRLPANASSSVIMLLLRTLLAQTDIVNDLKGKLAIIERGRIRLRKG